MDQYCIYLRKSRADLEAESHGEYPCDGKLETLARHERTLLEIAKKMGLNITEIYREVVSGETIAARPMMQKLLSEVEQGVWEGVLVMEVERLARGDTVDQGIMAQTFKYSETKIITPLKTYDPNNEFDEEYFEFGLFMARREYKTINRRLQRGRVSSVKEGNFVGNIAPYGYRRKKLENEKGYTLEPEPSEADVVRLIYSLYTSGDDNSSGQTMGAPSIAKYLTQTGYDTRSGGKWSAATVREILKNPAYIGKVRWNRRARVKKMQDGKMTASRPRNTSDTHVIYDGKHEPIIDETTFNDAQHRLQSNANPAVPSNRSLQNPLAGIIVCDLCGRNMVRRPYTSGNKSQMAEASLMCPNPYCENVSSSLRHVEAELLSSLQQWLDEYKLNIMESGKNKPATSLNLSKKELEETESSIAKTKKQIDTLYNLLEQEVYTADVFLERSRTLYDTLESLENSKESLIKKIKEEDQRKNVKMTLIPKIEHLLSVYDSVESPVTKNTMLKEVIHHVYYKKEAGAKWNRKKGLDEDFALKLYPHLP